MNCTLENIKKYSIECIKYILAILFYFLVMEYLGGLIIIPLFRKIFDINTLNILNTFSSPYVFIASYYKEAMGLINSTLQMSIYFLLFVGLIAILFHDIRIDSLDYQAHKEERERSFLISLLIYFGINMITGMLIMILSKYLQVDVISQNQANLEAMAESSMLSYVVLGVTVVIMGPLVEELIFRKSLFKIIPNDIAAIAISAVLFGLMHTYQFDYTMKELIVVTLPYLSSGIAFGICYKISNHNILMVYMLHAGLNLFSLIMMLY